MNYPPVESASSFEQFRTPTIKKSSLPLTSNQQLHSSFLSQNHNNSNNVNFESPYYSPSAKNGLLQNMDGDEGKINSEYNIIPMMNNETVVISNPSPITFINNTPTVNINPNYMPDNVVVEDTPEVTNNYNHNIVIPNDNEVTKTVSVNYYIEPSPANHQMNYPPNVIHGPSIKNENSVSIIANSMNMMTTNVDNSQTYNNMNMMSPNVENLQNYNNNMTEVNPQVISMNYANNTTQNSSYIENNGMIHGFMTGEMTNSPSKSKVESPKKKKESQEKIKNYSGKLIYDLGNDDDDSSVGQGDNANGNSRASSSRKAISFFVSADDNGNSINTSHNTESLQDRPESSKVYIYIYI